MKGKKKILSSWMAGKYAVMFVAGLTVSFFAVYASTTTIQTTLHNATQVIQRILVTQDGSAAGNVVMDINTGGKVLLNQLCDLNGENCKEVASLSTGAGGGGGSESYWSSGTNGISYVNGRVGIGTASPTNALHVSGTAHISSDFSVGGDLFFDSRSSASIGLFSLAIGGTAGHALNIVGQNGYEGAGGDVKLLAGSAGRHDLGENNEYDGGDVYICGGNEITNGGRSTALPGDVVLAHNGTDAIGKVGIGTTTPSELLTVAGVGLFNGLKLPSITGNCLATDENGIVIGTSCGAGGESYWTKNGGMLYYTGGEIQLAPNQSIYATYFDTTTNASFSGEVYSNKIYSDQFCDNFSQACHTMAELLATSSDRTQGMDVGIFYDGKVGIGVEASSAYTGALQISGDINLMYGSDRSITVASYPTAPNNGNSLYIFAADGRGTRRQNPGFPITYNTTPANGGNVTINGGSSQYGGVHGNVLLGTNGGNIGIGTDTPTSLLTVGGDVSIINGGLFANDAYSNKYMSLDPVNYIYQIGDIDRGMNGSYLTIDSANSKSYFLNTNVGIGTDSPTSALTVSGDIQANRISIWDKSIVDNTSLSGQICDVEGSMKYYKYWIVGDGEGGTELVVCMDIDGQNTLKWNVIKSYAY